jgi:predicted TIM-barrel fold metal-dependent hydrolase
MDPMTLLGVTHSTPAFDMPSGACDCHVHVFGPIARYPFAAERMFTPGPASVEDLVALQRTLGLERVVIVQPSPYGTDNACMLDAVQRLGARARAVAVIDAATSDAALKDMDRAGVRGVRLNLETFGGHDPAVAGETLRATASRVAPLGWHVQIFTNLAVIDPLREAIQSLPVPLVVDHFGRKDAAQGISQPGFATLVSLVKSGRIYVKLSAPHRMSAQPDYADAAAIARALIDANPERMLWGSDWPHTGGRPGVPRRPEVIEPFRPEDDGAALNRLQSWTSGTAQLRKILVENPARLYGF